MRKQDTHMRACIHTHTSAHTQACTYTHGSKAAGMHKAGEATQRTSAVCARPLHESSWATSYPQVPTSQYMEPQVRSKDEGEDLHPKPGCDSFCPEKLCLSSRITPYIHATHMQAGSRGLSHRGYTTGGKNSYVESW